MPLIGAVVLGVATSLLVVAQAILLGRVIAGAFPGGDSLSQVSGDLWILIAVVGARALCAFGFETSGRLGARRVVGELRASLTAQMLETRPAGLRGQRAGELVTNAVQGLSSLEAYFARYLPQLVLAVVVPVVILLYVFPNDLAAGTILLVTLPIIPLFMILIGLAARTATERRWRTLSLLSAHFLDAVKGLQTLKANDRAQRQVESLRETGEQYRQETMVTLRIAFLSSLVLELAAMMGTALVAAAVAIQLINGGLGFATALAVLLLAPELYLPIRMVGQQFHASTDGLTAAQQCFALLDTPAAVSAPSSPLPAPSPRDGALVLENVSFAYEGRGESVLESIDLTLSPGEQLALVGPSGQGKSTVAALILRLLDPQAGRMLCNGVNLLDVDPKAWRRQLAWVPQRPTLFSATLAENIRLGRPEADETALLAACADAGLERLIDSLPEGLETPLGEGQRTLSAGETQRVALARAFLRDAPLVILDEPTAHLDAESSAAIGQSIARLSISRSVLLIVHRPALAAAADRIITLREGIVVDGQVER
ncbi:MAG: thiol reductant ABC exporter subunit CydD [Solirubrobacterales bacterium]|nr:thiol reductant ABC exporter subunit CydD [Solirubrobacterales bacterium]